MKIALVAAIEKSYGIGKDNKLLWNLPADMEWFRLITISKPVILGRKTYESIGHALPERECIVLTTDPSFEPKDALVASTIEEAIHLAGESVEVLVIGGEEVYKAFLPIADSLYITQVDANLPADRYFPAWGDDFEIIYRANREKDDENEFDMNFTIYQRIEK